MSIIGYNYLSVRLVKVSTQSMKVASEGEGGIWS